MARSKDEALAVTPEWKRAVAKWMEDPEHQISRSKLAADLGVTRGAITQLFKTAKTSTLVSPINRMMRSSPHSVEAQPAEKHAATEFARRLLRANEDPQERERLANELNSMTEAQHERVFMALLSANRDAMTRSTAALERDYAARIDLHRARAEEALSREALATFSALSSRQWPDWRAEHSQGTDGSSDSVDKRRR
jgi:hypothetical protein